MERIGLIVRIVILRKVIPPEISGQYLTDRQFNNMDTKRVTRGRRVSVTCPPALKVIPSPRVALDVLKGLPTPCR